MEKNKKKCIYAWLRIVAYFISGPLIAASVADAFITITINADTANIGTLYLAAILLTMVTGTGVIAILSALLKKLSINDAFEEIKMRRHIRRSSKKIARKIMDSVINVGEENEESE